MQIAMESVMTDTNGCILLVVPPFQGTTSPALGVSLLKANLEKHGYKSEILYLNLSFAQRIGLDMYQWICAETMLNGMLGEFIFSSVLFDHSDSEIQRYIEEVLCNKGCKPHFGITSDDRNIEDMLRRIIQEASQWYKQEALPAILAYKPWIVGLTSCFQQNCASLLLIKEVKRAQPDIVTIMGGANCEGEMGEELFALFKEIDYIGQGECDISLIELVRSLKKGKLEQPIPGILSREFELNSAPSQPLEPDDLNRLPYPDFRDYFTQLAATSFKERIIPGIVMETARGCWWGVKYHCTFCGVNGLGMAYRSKSAARALAEISYLINLYGIPRIMMTDNILDMQYFKTVLPQLAENPTAELFYEVKSNLTKDQIRLMARANVKMIQPGIESMSDKSLAIMRKGNSALQNIQLLKWCAESGISVAWTYLYGFPGEDESELSEIKVIIEAISHLGPPMGVGTVHLDRFSPYFMASDRKELEPRVPYRYIYPFPLTSLVRLAYVHHSEAFDRFSRSQALKNLEDVVAPWQSAYQHSHLLAVPRGESLILIDTRPSAKRYWYKLTDKSRRIYEYCDKSRGFNELIGEFGDPTNPDELQNILLSFINAGIMLRLNNRYLSLATEAGKSYRNFVGIMPHGHIRSKRLLDQLSCMLKNKVPLKDITEAITHKALRGMKSVKYKLQSAVLGVIIKLISKRG